LGFNRPGEQKRLDKGEKKAEATTTRFLTETVNYVLDNFFRRGRSKYILLLSFFKIEYR
jgi:hypothetical protein